MMLADHDMPDMSGLELRIIMVARAWGGRYTDDLDRPADELIAENILAITAALATGLASLAQLGGRSRTG